MSDSVCGIQGEYRRFTPREVGLFIRDCREQMGLKRLAVAAEAGLTEKTLERAEAGKGVSEDSCRRIAIALGLKPDTFTGKMFVPNPVTQEEFEQNERRLKEEWERTHDAIAVLCLHEVRDVLPFFGTCGLVADNDCISDQHLEAFASLKQNFVDWSDVSGEVSEAARIAGARNVLEGVREFEALGYVVKGTVVERYVIGGRDPKRPSKWPMSFIVAFKKPKGTRDTTPAEVWLPKRLPLTSSVSDKIVST